MALTESEIQECTKRYIREFDRYTKMSEIVYQKCQEIVQKKLTLRATIQRRTKDPRSFADKLRKPKNKEQRTKNKEQRTKNKEQRTKNKEQRKI